MTPFLIQIKPFFAGFALAGIFIASAQANQVALQNATASYSQTNPSLPGLWDPYKTIDGAASGAFTSWAIYRDNGIQAESIVWETQSDLTLNGSQALRFELSQQDYIPSPGHNLGRFRLSYTTVDRSQFADGLANAGDVSANWVLITPGSVNSSGGETMTLLPDSSVLVSGSLSAYPTYTVMATLGVSGITGFRMEALKDESLPFGGPGRENTAGNFHLSEFSVAVVPEPSTIPLLLAGLGILVVRRRSPARAP